jgi:hypothetical protein
MDALWGTIQQFVNIPATIIAVVLTQGIKWYLPSPTAEKSFTLIPGFWMTRLMPLCPIILGMVGCFLIEWGFTQPIAVKGVMSGIFAAYLYRTTQVSIFGV